MPIDTQHESKYAFGSHHEDLLTIAKHATNSILYNGTSSAEQEEQKLRPIPKNIQWRKPCHTLQKQEEQTLRHYLTQPSWLHKSRHCAAVSSGTLPVSQNPRAELALW